MKIVTDVWPLGLREVRTLTFSKAEQAALRRAAQIGDQARKLYAASVDYDTEGENVDTALAMIGCSVDDVIDGFEL